MSLQVSSEYLLDKCFNFSKNLEKKFNYVTTKNVDESLYFFSNNQLKKIDFSTGFFGYSLPFFFTSYNINWDQQPFFFEKRYFDIYEQKVRGISEYYNYNNAELFINGYYFNLYPLFILSFQNKQFIYTKYGQSFGLFDCVTNTFSCSSLNSEIYHGMYICNDEDRVLSFGASSVESINLLDNSRFVLNYSLKLNETFFRTLFHYFLKDKLFFGENTYSYAYINQDAYNDLGFFRKIYFYLGSTKDYAMFFKFSIYVIELYLYTYAAYSHTTVSNVYSSKGNYAFSCGSLSDTWKSINEVLDKIRDFTPSVSNNNSSPTYSSSSFTTGSQLFGSVLNTLFSTNQTSSTNQTYSTNQSNILPQSFAGGVTYSFFHEASKLASFIGVPLYVSNSNNYFNNVVPERYWVYRASTLRVNSLLEQSIPYKISYLTGTISNLSNTLDFMSVKKITYNKLPSGFYRFCSLFFDIYYCKNSYSYNYKDINFFISNNLDLCAYDSSLDLEFVVSKDIYVYGLNDYIEFYPSSIDGHNENTLWDRWKYSEKKVSVLNSNKFFNVYGSKNFGFCFISGRVFYGRGPIWSDDVTWEDISLVFAINLDTKTISVFSNMVGEPDYPLKFR